MSRVVLGHYPQYVEASESLGLRHFELSPDTWNSLPSTQAWFENRYFLNRAIERGDRFVYSHSPLQANPGTSFPWELRYLRSRGIILRPPRGITVFVS